MKHLFAFFVCVLSFCALHAQSVSKVTVDQYRQLIGWTGESISTCSERLTKWGFEYNKGGIINMFTMQAHPFFRAEGADTVGAMLSEIDGVIYSVSGIYSSREPSHTFALISQAAVIQQQLATERGLTKFVCSVKGKVSNKFPKNTDELVAILAEASSETVSDVYVTWKGSDGRDMLSLIYDNKFYGKKKPKSHYRAELTLGYGITPEK